jgi:hypothetical protein
LVAGHANAAIISAWTATTATPTATARTIGEVERDTATSRSEDHGE